MKGKKLAGICLFILSVVPLAWGSARVAEAVSVRAEYEEQYAYDAFEYSEMYASILGGGYEQKIPVKDMAEALERVQTNIVTAERQGNLPSPKTVLPTDLTYYEEPNAESAVLMEIPKGTEVLYFLDTETCMAEYGYGVCSFPGYEAGWRCVRPFLRAEEAASQDPAELAGELPYGYIRLEELEAVSREYYTEVPQGSIESSLSMEERIFEELRATDKEFYQKGICNSPDLLYPVWDMWDTVLACVFALLFLSGCILLVLAGKSAASEKVQK